MAWLVIRRARMDISSLYRHDIRAMGRKLLGSVVEFFLWIRIVVAVFQWAGTSLASKQCFNMQARISHLGSRRRYSSLSLPGAELENDRNFWESSSGVGGGGAKGSCRFQGRECGS